MNEPTREQIKEAFKETIERWEKIVEDVDYHNKSKCSLCSLFPGYSGSCNQNVCPVAVFAESFGCTGTPYHVFNEDKTPANALAELNFLRKVYIWWMEKEANKIWEKYGTDKPKKEEKKEEWEDITKEVTWKTEGACDKDYWLVGYYDNRLIFITAEHTVIELNSKPDEENYKTEMTDIGGFRILKKT